MGAGQVIYIFQSSDGRRIEVRGFSLRDNMLVSSASVKTNQAHQNQQIPLVPNVRPGAPVDVEDLKSFARENGYTFTESVEGGNQSTVESELVNDLTLAIDDLEGFVTLSWGGSAGVVVAKSASLDGVFLTVFEGTSATFEDTDVSVGQTWYYKIKKVVGGKISAFGNVVEAVVEAVNPV